MLIQKSNCPANLLLKILLLFKRSYEIYPSECYFIPPVILGKRINHKLYNYVQVNLKQ